MRNAPEPISNGVMLPLGAFSAAPVAIPQVALSEIPAPLWGTLAALPVGKVVGITPTTVKVLAGGATSITLSKEGFAPDTQKIAPRQNNATHHVSLKRALKTR